MKDLYLLNLILNMRMMNMLMWMGAKERKRKSTSMWRSSVEVAIELDSSRREHVPLMELKVRKMKGGNFGS